jgi:hypothetical protein
MEHHEQDATLSATIREEVIAGGPAHRSRRAVLAIVLLAASLLAWSTWQLIAAQTGPTRRLPPSAASRPPAGLAPTVATLGPLPHPSSRGSDVALRQWYRSLPVAAMTDPRPPSVSSLFRVRHQPGYTGGSDFSAVAQVHGATGWMDVARGDISAGQVDADGRHVAFIARVPSPTERHVRAWAYVVSVPDVVVLVIDAVVRQSMVGGWFGDRVVIDQSAVGLPPVLLDGAGRAAPRELARGISVVGDGEGDVQFVGSDLGHCLTGWWLGLLPRMGSDLCPGSAVVALSPRGRWGVTRDLRWLDRFTEGATNLTGRSHGWLAESVDFVNEQHALVVIRDATRQLTVLCTVRAGCARPAAT